MKELFTPKQIAKAIQVSESSIKRWCDQGLIATSYTAGGHRRVQVSAFLEFVKTHGYQ
ncbi:MAG: helix-turn-helix domain-containing protein, partial [Planctomycetota bacterium]